MIMARARCRLGATRLSTSSRSSLCFFVAKSGKSRFLIPVLVLISDSGSEQVSGVGFQQLKISNTKSQIPNGSTSSPPHHPEPSRRANHNDLNSKSQTIGV